MAQALFDTDVETPRVRKPEVRKTDRPPLIDMIRQKAEESKLHLTREEEADLLAIEAKRRDQLIRFKAQLFDTPWDELAESVRSTWEERWTKMADWIDEYERTIRRLVQGGVRRDEWYCPRCQSLIASPFRNGRNCPGCTENPKLRILFDEIEQQGWAVRYIQALKERVIFLRDTKTTIPADCRDLVTYTLPELHIMKGASRDQVAQVHEIKKTFGGRVVE